jgi:hypothetical protein
VDVLLLGKETVEVERILATRRTAAVAADAAGRGIVAHRVAVLGAAGEEVIGASVTIIT